MFQSSPGTYSQFIVRLAGIDGPEMNSHDVREVNAALKARNRLLSLLAPKAFDQTATYSKKDVLRLLADNPTLVYLHLGSLEKFGRTLAEIFTTDGPTKSVNQILLDEELVHAYAGKTKQPWVWPDL